VYSVVPSPTGQREKKAMTDLVYEVSLDSTDGFGLKKMFKTCCEENLLKKRFEDTEVTFGLSQ
jgi:hypothetical protein